MPKKRHLTIFKLVNLEKKLKFVSKLFKIIYGTKKKAFIKISIFTTAPKLALRALLACSRYL